MSNDLAKMAKESPSYRVSFGGSSGVSAGQIAWAVKGELVGLSKDSKLYAVTTDTRELLPGDLFFALPGEKTDGHKFLPSAFASGAGLSIVSRSWFAHNRAVEKPLLVVADTLQALGYLAAWYRGRFSLKVAAITGSSGKTTAKEMTVGALSGSFKTTGALGNFNNLIGLPLSVFTLNQEHRAAVYELGISRMGEMGRLTLICRPDFGVVLNISEAHLEGLGSKEKVMEAKLELADGLPPDGRLFLNADDSLLSTYRARSEITIRWFGIEKKADFRATDLKLNVRGGYDFLYNGKLSVSLSILGRHQVYNALAALALCEVMGADLEKASQSLSRFHPVAWRMELEQVAGLTILNDSYNANPDSMRAALATLAEQKAARRVACLGDMKELGEKSKDLHAEVGRAAASAGLDLLVAVGAESKTLADAAVASGMDSKKVFWFISQKEALEFLLGFLSPGDMVLVKASRGSGLDLLVSGLKEGFRRN